MDISGSYPSPLQMIGLKIAEQSQAALAQVVLAAMEDAKQTTATPPTAASSASTGGIDLRV